jgi:lipoprotein-releasing system ATP-binding protein
MENNLNNIVLEVNHISKNFHDPVTVKVLDDICFSVNKGEFISVTGKSGCGKSTLLYVLSTMDSDYTGELIIDNETMAQKNEEQLAEIRNKKIGFVFQFHYLLNEFSVLDNVMLPALKLDKYPEHIIRQRALQKLEMLEIGKLASKKPNQISGGEKQRVSIARAMINDPEIIMGDEPTGNLDKKNSEIVFNIFQRMAAELNQTLLIVTHDRSFAEKTHRIIEMEDGRIINK